MKKFEKATMDGNTAATPDAPEIDFYGEPEYRIQISDYILLKNIRAVIWLKKPMS